MIVFHKGKAKRFLDIPVFGKEGDKRFPLILTPGDLNTFMEEEERDAGSAFIAELSSHSVPHHTQILRRCLK